MSTDAQYMVKEIMSKLVGAIIIDAITSTDDDDATFGFIVRRDDKEFPVWVDCDAEGNGPGWLSIE